MRGVVERVPDRVTRWVSTLHYSYAATGTVRWLSPMSVSRMRSWLTKFAAWYHSLSDEDSDTYFIKSVIKSTLTLMVAVPFIKLLEAFIFYANTVLAIPSQPLLIVNRPLIEVVIAIGDLAILVNYVVLLVFGLVNLVVREVKRLLKNIQTARQ